MLKVVVHGTHLTHPYVNSFHVKFTGSIPDQNTANSIAEALVAQYWTAFGPVLSTLTVHTISQAIDLSTRTSFVGNAVAAHAGSHAGGGGLIASTAVCMSQVIQARYRGGHPRMYLPLGDASWISNGSTILPTNLTAYQAAGAAFKSGVDGLATAGLTYKLWAVRYWDQHQLLVTPQTYPVNSVTTHSRVDSMRRRTGKEVL
jgi:hypothetical protein